MAGELKRRGVTQQVLSPDPLALDAPAQFYTNAAATLGAEAVLLVLPREGAVDRIGRDVLRRFHAGLFSYDGASGRGPLLWRADMTVRAAGSYIGPDSMATLARDMAAKLQQDGWLERPPSRRSAAAQPAPAWHPPVP